MRTAIALTGILLVPVLAGCGAAPATPGPNNPSGGAGTERPAADPGQRALQFARCMREHGVDMPDPDPNNPGQIKLGGPGTDAGKIQEAAQSCREFSPIGGGGTSSDGGPAQREARLKFAACMREHGVENWPDPANASGPTMIGPELTDDPDFEAAAQACQPLLREAFGDTF